MGRPNRAADGGLIFHVLNRGNARITISEKVGEEAKRFLTPFLPLDFDDAIQLIRINALPQDYSGQLNSFVHEKFLELWQAAQISEDY